MEKMENREEISVYVNGILRHPASYSFLEEGVIVFSYPLPPDVSVEIRTAEVFVSLSSDWASEDGKTLSHGVFIPADSNIEKEEPKKPKLVYEIEDEGWTA